MFEEIKQRLEEGKPLSDRELLSLILAELNLINATLNAFKKVKK